ncbi:MAG: ABC transporter substrate-binding protein [Sphaerochaetaceae bacterium]
MKKRIVFVFVLLLTIGILFAQPAQETSSSDKPVELTFWSLFTGGDGEFFDAMIKEFNESQNEVKMVNSMVKFDDYYTKLTTALAAKTAPDVVVCHQANLLNYVPNGSFLALDQYIDKTTLDDFQQEPLNACRFDGKLYSLPLDVHPIVFYYNKDILKEAGITTLPSSAEDFIKDSQIIKEKTGKWGMLVDNTTGTYKAYTLTRLFFSMMKQEGGSFLTSDNKKANFNNEKGVAALNFLKDTVNTYKINPDQLDYDAAMNQFKLGEGAFYFNGVWATGTLETVKGLNFGAAPLPAFFGKEDWAWAGSHTLAIPTQKNQDPKKVQAAVKFIEWMTAHGELWAKAGHIPTRKSVAAKDSFKALPYRADYVGAAQYAMPSPSTAAWNEIYGTSSDLLEAAVTKNQDTKTALANMEKVVNEIISKY